ncbi:MAG: 50S ribosomal protein L24 [Luteolibacter sp.]
MSSIKTHVKKGDNVQIIAGNHKGKTGQVLSINVAKGQVVVEGGRTVTKATRPSEGDEGGLKTVDAPIHISNVKKLG